MRQTSTISNEMNSEVLLPSFGYELIRDVLIPDILGKDTPQLLYWAGKTLARKYPLSSIDEMISFFEEASWGSLTVLKEKKSEYLFELSGGIVARRFQSHPTCTFQLEAGFIAQQLQQQLSYITETFEQTKKKSKTVLFTAKTDKKDPTT